jgi:hypothetical protein
MEPLVLRPEDFAQKWAEIFEDVPMTGEVWEQTVRTKMRELKDCLVPQLLGTWLYVLGHTCKLIQQKQGYRWRDVVQHYHSLIARIIQSEAYSHFTSNHLEDRIFLEGVALWAGHDYSDPFGSEICYFVNTYRKAVVRKKEINWTYQGWSANVQRILHGDRVLREIASLSVLSMRSRGLKKALFAPKHLRDKINRNPNGVLDLEQCVQKRNPPQIRPFTRFMAKDIATRVNPWPTEKEVDQRMAPLQILEAWEKHQGGVKLESPEASPLASPRGPIGSPVLSPAKKKAARDTANAAAVKSQIAQTLVGNPDAQGTTYCSIAAPPPKKPRERKEDAPQPERNPSATGQECAAEEMEVDSEATDSDEELPNREILAQRHQGETPKAGGSEVQKTKKKKKRKETLRNVG